MGRGPEKVPRLRGSHRLQKVNITLWIAAHAAAPFSDSDAYGITTHTNENACKGRQSHAHRIVLCNAARSLQSGVEVKPRRDSRQGLPHLKLGNEPGKHAPACRVKS